MIGLSACGNLNSCGCGDGVLVDQTVAGYTNGVAPGQELQLYWFPSLTLASNTVGVTFYGKYTDTNSPPLDGGGAWQLPNSGTSVNLVFLTAFWSGSNPESAGWATHCTTVAPVAVFTASPTAGLAPLSVTFDDTSTGATPLTLYWDLGDGTKVTNSGGGSIIAHPYAAGVYTVTLTASNSVNTSTLVSNRLIWAETALESWQTHYFGSTNRAMCGGDVDFDGTGISNTNKFLSGFNPTNAAAYAHITSIVKSNGDIRVTYLAANGDNTWSPGIISRTNILEFTTGDPHGGCSNNFASTGQTNILSGGNGLGTNVTAVDAGNATGTTRYYRIRVRTP